VIQSASDQQRWRRLGTWGYSRIWTECVASGHLQFAQLSPPLAVWTDIAVERRLRNPKPLADLPRRDTRVAHERLHLRKVLLAQRPRPPTDPAPLACRAYLATDYIDVLYVHAWDFLTPVEEVLRGLDDLVRQGKVLYVGISDTPAWVISRANAIADLKAWTSFIAMQAEYSLVERTPERDLLPMARALGITPLAWSPLASGILTGKYSGEAAEAGRLDSAPFHALSDRNLAIADAVIDVADEVDRPPAQVALAWVRQRGALPLLGATKPRHLKSNLESLSLTLSGDHMTALTEASRIDLGFPHEFLEGTRPVTYGGYYGEIDGERRGAPLHW